MIYSSIDIECDRLKLVILGHFLLFYFPENPKNQNFAKIKKTAGYITIYIGYITNVCQKPQSYGGRFLRYGVKQIEFFCHFEPFFALIPPNDPEKQNF